MPSSTPADKVEAPASPAPTLSASTFTGRYVGGSARTYRFPGAPITVEPGDVAALPYDPGDGMWQASTAKPTRLADNHPDSQPKSPNPADVAHSLAERDAILTRLGVDAPKEA